MKTACTTGPILGLTRREGDTDAQRAGLADAIRLIAAGGYDRLDLSVSIPDITAEDGFWNKGNYEETTRLVNNVCAESGIDVGQIHAPFTFRWEDPVEFKETAVPAVIQSLKIASLVGAKIAVVHPLHHLHYKDYGAMLYDRTLDYYKMLLPYAHEYGVKIATENMFQPDVHGVMVQDMFADVNEFRRALETINDPNLIACVDVGHCGLGRCCTAGEMIRALGHDWVKALHIHDNSGIYDTHTIPYLGELDWDDICAALKEIDYDGDFCMEVLGSWYKRFTDRELLVKAIGFANDVGRSLIRKIEA